MDRRYRDDLWHVYDRAGYNGDQCGYPTSGKRLWSRSARRGLGSNRLYTGRGRRHTTLAIYDLVAGHQTSLSDCPEHLYYQLVSLRPVHKPADANLLSHRAGDRRQLLNAGV